MGIGRDGHSATLLRDGRVLVAGGVTYTGSFVRVSSAFLDHYDACVLMSDDSDFLPAVSRVQEYFGRKVIQAGFKDIKLRDQCYAHIAWERAGRDLGFNEQQQGGDAGKRAAQPQQGAGSPSD